jgi:hypothetical protein
MVTGGSRSTANPHQMFDWNASMERQTHPTIVSRAPMIPSKPASNARALVTAGLPMLRQPREIGRGAMRIEKRTRPRHFDPCARVVELSGVSKFKTRSNSSCDDSLYSTTTPPMGSTYPLIWKHRERHTARRFGAEPRIPDAYQRCVNRVECAQTHAGYNMSLRRDLPASGRSERWMGLVPQICTDLRGLRLNDARAKSCLNPGRLARRRAQLVKPVVPRDEQAVALTRADSSVFEIFSRIFSWPRRI